MTDCSNTIKSIKNKTISDYTIRKYISYFENAFLISKSIRYHIKGKQNNGKNCRAQLEVDFIPTHGSEKLYVQSALNIDDADKKLQEKRPLSNTHDNFRKVIVVKGQTKPRYDDNGIMLVGVIDFLTNRNSYL